MLTFSYNYCDNCKIEVAEASSTPKKEWNPFEDVLGGTGYASYGGPNRHIKSFSALPPGYVALKGEAVVCNSCGYTHGVLNQDLPVISGRRGNFASYVDIVPSMLIMPCCPDEEPYRRAPDGNLYNIKGRGFI